MMQFPLRVSDDAASLASHSFRGSDDNAIDCPNLLFTSSVHRIAASSNPAIVTEAKKSKTCSTDP